MSFWNYGIFYPSYVPTIVKLEKVEGRPKDIKVDFPPIEGATEYRIYGSLSPTIRTLISTYTTPPPYFIKFPVSKVILPEELIVHIWVSYVRNGQETFIQQEPATYFTAKDKQAEMFERYYPLPTIVAPNPAGPSDYIKATIPYEMMAFYRDEIRRRHIATLEIGGEEWILYKRRREGPVCPECMEPKLTGNVTQVGSSRPIPFDPTIKNEQVSPRYSGRARCEVCFGTGIIGGYYFPIRIKVSYWGMPSLKIKTTDKGLELDRVPNAWTLWTPYLTQHDILHRVVSGERFVITDVKISTWQGVILRQGFTTECLDADDIRVRVNKDAIFNALTKYNLIDKEEEVPLWI